MIPEMVLGGGLPKRAVPARNTFSSFYASPLYLNDFSHFYMSATASSSTNITVKVTLFNNLFPNGKEICTHTFKSKSTFIYKYDNKYTQNNGNELQLTIITGKSTTVTDKLAIEVCKPSKIVLNEERSIRSNSRIYYYSNTGWKSVYEDLTFDGFEDYYVPDYYHKIDFSLFKVSSSKSLDELLDAKAAFYISNKDGYFDGFTSSGDYSKFDLEFIEDGTNSFHLEFKNRLFVNQLNLKMSNEKKADYVETKYLFLPRNEMRHQEDYDCYLSFEKLGVDKLTLSFHFKLNALINTIGDCHNSEYCIIES